MKRSPPKDVFYQFFFGKEFDVEELIQYINAVNNPDKTEKIFYLAQKFLINHGRDVRKAMPQALVSASQLRAFVGKTIKDRMLNLVISLLERGHYFVLDNLAAALGGNFRPENDDPQLLQLFEGYDRHKKAIWENAQIGGKYLENSTKESKKTKGIWGGL